ncbi:MAG: hypothetical protein AAB778_00535 [Patescibacteria group bacterium]
MENNPLPIANSPQTTVTQPSTVDSRPKANNFLVVLLSVLLFISVAIAGFFAYQTQKLIKELRMMSNESKQTVEPTLEPVITNNVVSASDIPVSISKLYDSINSNFKINLVPVAENNFYSPDGMITKNSWKLDLIDANLGKSLVTFLNTQLTPNYSDSGGIGGGGIDAYENSNIKCFHSYMSQGPDIHNYLSCAEK